ncbi:MAG: 4Fe-4S binding protein [Planctomycetota bacterium]
MTRVSGPAFEVPAARDRAALPAVREHKPGCGSAAGELGEPRSTRGRWRAWVLLLIHVAAAVHVWHWLESGSTITPMEPSEAGETLTTGAVNAGFVLFALAIGSTLLLGRFFCGWACHVVALQDASRWILNRFGLRPRAVRSRSLAFAPLAAALLMFVIPSLVQAYEDRLPSQVVWHLTTDDLWARFPGPFITALTFLVCGFLMVWWLGSKGFCTYACPYGAVFGLVEPLAPGRIRVDDSCEGCGHCTAVCTSNVQVHREVNQFGMVVDPGCMRCLDCVSACPKDALSFAWGKPALGKSPKQPAPKPKADSRYDFTAGEELFLFAAFAFGLWSFRGLYELVPFLLAMGLSVLFAFTGLILWRAFTRGDFRFQHWSVKRDGRWTGAGRAVGLVAVAGLLLGLHSSWMRYESREGTRLLSVAGEQTGVAREATIQDSRARLERVDRYGLHRSAALDNKLASIYLATGEQDAAVERFRAAADKEPKSYAPRRRLVNLLIQQGEWDAAGERHRELAALRPASDEETAAFAQRVVPLIQADPEAVGPQLLLARILARAGDLETALGNLGNLALRHPDDGRVTALVAELEAAR